jgi:polysaccharide pyruvyl transferase WcaK-like protein
MLQVAVERLLRQSPGSAIRVLTYEEDALRRFCPQADAVSLRGWDRWRQAKVLPRWLCRESEQGWRRRNAALFRRLWSAKATIFRGKYLAGLEFLEELDRADALIMAGCGMLNDCFRDSSLRALSLLESAVDRGLFTALLSQGIGPMEDSVLRDRAAEVLPRIESIFIREEHTTGALLKRLNVSPERVFFTGDDALEIGLHAGKKEMGNNLGFNLRLSTYSGVSGDTVEAVRRVLVEKARREGALLRGTPITRDSADCDMATARGILAGLGGTHDVGEDLDTPLKVARRIGECRVVVTGSYHVAVFAMAQGVSAVCVAGNDYYRAKFAGLADKFGDGCVVVGANKEGFEAVLTETIDRLWNAAPRVRESLRQEAGRQCDLGLAGYARLISRLTRQDGRRVRELSTVTP